MWGNETIVYEAMMRWQQERVKTFLETNRDATEGLANALWDKRELYEHDMKPFFAVLTGKQTPVEEDCVSEVADKHSQTAEA